MPTRTLFAGFLAATLLQGCAAPSPARPEFPPNPPGCEGVVQQHLAKPTMEVSVPPRPSRLSIPPCRWCQSERVSVRLVVDESGIPIPGTIELGEQEGLIPARAIKEAASQWQFTPARMGECRVPALYVYWIRF